MEGLVAQDGGNPRKNLLVARYAVEKYEDLSTFTQISPQFRISACAHPYMLVDLSDVQGKLCDANMMEIEDVMNGLYQRAPLTFIDTSEDTIKPQLVYLTTCARLHLLRREFMQLTLHTHHIQTQNQVEIFLHAYRSRIMIESARMYHAHGSKGSATNAFLLRDMRSTSSTSDFNSVAQRAFEVCQVSVLTVEIMRDYTTNIMRQVESTLEKLIEERTGRIFRAYPTTTNTSPVDNRLAFKITEKDYTEKAELIERLVTSLQRQSTLLTKDLVVKNVTSVAISNDKIFMCPKEALSECVHQLALDLSRWHQHKSREQEAYAAELYGHLSATVKHHQEKIAKLQLQLAQFGNEFQRDVRLAGADRAADLAMELAIASMELNEFRKTRRVEEKRIRAKVVEEYEDLVRELTNQIYSLRMRFQEYRASTLHDAMQIMSETKKEEFQVLVDSPEYSGETKANAAAIIRNEDMLNELAAENNSLKLTISKLRTMHLLKDQTLRAMIEKKISKLELDNKTAEEKLWDSYRESKTRERVLRRQVTKLQKSLTHLESESQRTKNQLKEEQALVAKLQKYQASVEDENQQMNTRLSDLKQYEGLDIAVMLQHLAERAQQVAELRKEVDRRDANAKREAGVRERASSAKSRSSARSRSRSSRPVSARSFDSISFGGGSMAYVPEEILLDRLNMLTCENHRLRKYLASADISVPPIYAKTAEFMRQEAHYYHQDESSDAGDLLEPHEDLQACSVEDAASQASSCAPSAVQDKQHVHDAHVKFEDAPLGSASVEMKTSANQSSPAADASRQRQESVFDSSRSPSGEARENASFTVAASTPSLSAVHTQPGSPTSFRKQGKAEQWGRPSSSVEAMPVSRAIGQARPRSSSALHASRPPPADLRRLTANSTARMSRPTTAGTSSSASRSAPLVAAGFSACTVRTTTPGSPGSVSSTKLRERTSSWVMGTDVPDALRIQDDVRVIARKRPNTAPVRR